MTTYRPHYSQHQPGIVTGYEAMTKERPILFSAPMIRAILDGRKTQTRRVVKFNHKPWLQPLPHVEYARDGMPIWWGSPPNDSIRQSDYYDEGYPCPHGRPGERLWVRETWAPRITDGDVDQRQRYVKYRADGHESPSDENDWHTWEHKWRPSIFMPRWASRITLEITGVRVERLQEISEADALAEGIYIDPDTSHTIPGEEIGISDPREAFAYLWERINGTGSWEANAWVWVIEFKRLEDK